MVLIFTWVTTNLSLMFEVPYKIPHRCYRRSKPTPRRRGTLLQAVATIRGGGRPGVRTQRPQLRGRDESAAMVHHRMLPRPRRRSDDRAGSHGAGRPTERHRPTSGGEPKHRLRGYGKRQERIGDCGTDDGGRGLRI